MLPKIKQFIILGSHRGKEVSNGHVDKISEKYFIDWMKFVLSFTGIRDEYETPHDYTWHVALILVWYLFIESTTDIRLEIISFCPFGWFLLCDHASPALHR